MALWLPLNACWVCFKMIPIEQIGRRLKVWLELYIGFFEHFTDCSLPASFVFLSMTTNSHNRYMTVMQFISNHKQVKTINTNIGSGCINFCRLEVKHGWNSYAFSSDNLFFQPPNYVLYSYMYKTLIGYFIQSFGCIIACILRLLYIINKNRIAK